MNRCVTATAAVAAVNNYPRHERRKNSEGSNVRGHWRTVESCQSGQLVHVAQLSRDTPLLSGANNWTAVSLKGESAFDVTHEEWRLKGATGASEHT